MRKLILATLLILCMCVYASAGTTVVVVQGVAAGATGIKDTTGTIIKDTAGANIQDTGG